MFWSQRKWQSTCTSSTTGHCGSLSHSNQNLAAIGASSTATARWASCSSIARSELPRLPKYAAPLFTKADEPLDVDDWIRTIESKFSLLSVPCSEANKTRYAVQQLRGSARMWSDHYHGMSSRMLSGLIIFLLVFSIENSMSSWHLLRALALYCSMPRLSIICVNMLVIMRTPMLRSMSTSVEATVPSYRRG